MKRANSTRTMLRAVSKGNLPTAERVLRKKGRSMLHVHGTDGCTPLLMACKRGFLHMVQFFLQNGATIHDTDKDPKRQGCAVHYAAWGGHLNVLRYLLDVHGASMDSRDVVGNTPILYAVYGGHKHIVEELMRRGCSLRERNFKNHSAILQAACGGHLHILEWLLSENFSITDRDLDGNTALLFAAWGGHLNVMLYLLQHGASLREKNHNGHSVFLSAANGGRVEVVEWLMAQGFSLSETNNNGDTALLLAAYGGHLKLVQRLLQLGSSLSERNGCGFTPLLSAANGGQIEMARWLLNHGSSLSEADNDGYTSLILASCGGNLELVKFFIEQGSSLQERNDNGDTPLLLASYCGHKHVVEYLLQHGSKLDERNNTGMGVLISAANGGHAEVVRMLLEKTNAYGLEDTDEGGYTPFLLAAQRGHMPVVELLAVYGANMQARTSRHNNDAVTLAMDYPDIQAYIQSIQSYSPLQVACEARMVDRVHELLASGADPRCQEPGTPTCLQLAQTEQRGQACNPELLALLQDSRRPFSPYIYMLYGPSYRDFIFKLLLVKHALQRQHHQHGYHHLPYLPCEIWFHIASFVERSWFPESQTRVLVQLPAASRVRKSWRMHRYSRHSCTDDMQDMEDEEDDFEFFDIDDVPGRHETAIYPKQVAPEPMEIPADPASTVTWV